MYNNKVLVIDDEEAILDVFRSVLGPEKENGENLEALNRLLESEEECPVDDRRVFEVDTATQGKKGYELFAAALENGKPYAVVFVDMRMPPGWDGVRTIQEIHKLDPYAQIIVVTAYSDASVSEIVSMVGFTDRLLYLKKPFDEEEIRQLADSLAMRWNLEAKVRRFVNILEGIFNSLAGLDFTGNAEALRPFLHDVLVQVSDFLDTKDVFLAKIENDGVHFRVGLGRFSNGITVQPAFLRIVQRVLEVERLEEIFRVNEYVVMPIILRSCKNVVVGALNTRQIEGIDRLLEVLASNAAKILDQGALVHSLYSEINMLKKRERQLIERLNACSGE